MLKIHYSLESDVLNIINDITAPSEINIRVRNLVLKAKKGQSVARGEIIAEHPSKFGGAYHASASGKATKVNYHHLTIKCDCAENSVEPVDVQSMGPGKELLHTLQELGIDVAPFSSHCDNLVINGLNPEPGIFVAELLLECEKDILETGLRLAESLITPIHTMLAVARGTSYSLSGTESVSVKPKYPNSLNSLVIKAVTGNEFADDTKIMSIMDIYNLGLVAKFGLPVTDTIMTICGHNYRVPLGTPIRHLLNELDIPVKSGDKAVLGGPFRGEAVYSLDEGVKKGDHGLFIISAGEFPSVEDTTCINCGECVLSCPARILPNLISRYAEYEKFEMAKKYDLDSCFECGLCSFNCTIRRPILQYIRFAKDQLRVSGKAE
ncbi:4Fe-4S dicluster domain-containing protein [Maridesulfovibrio ferrireducens]|uniref:4Fe-4S dicluster domain-containing protein n=1 Tax=Maridesulfovibrio ferrireducens TaxID=246191 RepID=UPI001A301ACB|nr:4Fe-4S dicluster domain-containing protein [Maridesulfovibrio ferrireducens]MBI9110214.1 4Fe-4S dicluster domain-containing protein [Maridesulfovibrio ferrireducens]